MIQTLDPYADKCEERCQLQVAKLDQRLLALPHCELIRTIRLRLRTIRGFRQWTASSVSFILLLEQGHNGVPDAWMAYLVRFDDGYYHLYVCTRGKADIK
jgi:hypothetical protein